MNLAPKTTTRGAPHVRSLDALRGLLSAFVVAAHAWQIFSLPYTGEGWGNLVFGFPARAAVLFFFCLSGYVIAMSIHGNMRRHGRFDPIEYAMSRFMRIAPPFLGVVALTWVFALILDACGASVPGMRSAARPAFFAEPATQVLALLTLTVAGDLTGNLLNGPVWSLVFEIQLYVIAALAVLAWQWRGHRRMAVVVALAVYLCVFGIVGLKLRTLTYVAFGFGAAAYAFRGMNRRTLTWGIGAAILVSAPLGYWASFYDMTRLDAAWAWISFQVAASAAFALLVLAVSRTALVVSISDYSYTLYIFHFPLFLFVFFLLHRFWPDGLARWANLIAVVAVPFAVLVSACVGQLENLRLRVRRRPLPTHAAAPDETTRSRGAERGSL